MIYTILHYPPGKTNYTTAIVIYGLLQRGFTFSFIRALMFLPGTFSVEYISSEHIEPIPYCETELTYDLGGEG